MTFLLSSMSILSLLLCPPPSAPLLASWRITLLPILLQIQKQLEETLQMFPPACVWACVALLLSNSSRLSVLSSCPRPPLDSRADSFTPFCCSSNEPLSLLQFFLLHWIISTKHKYSVTSAVLKSSYDPMFPSGHSPHSYFFGTPSIFAALMPVLLFSKEHTTVRFFLPSSTVTSPVTVTSDLPVAKPNGQFLILILLGLPAESDIITLVSVR